MHARGSLTVAVVLYAFELLMADDEGNETLTSHWKTD